MPDFKKILNDSSIYYFDGGYGTLLQQRGLPAGMSPEIWGLKEPGVVEQVHADYLDAGADVLTTNTFGGSRPKLGLDADPYEMNKAMARSARKMAGENRFVAGSVGPTGHFIEPLGDMTFREMVEIYKEQIRGLADGGADLILAETHFDLAEVRAIVVAARQVTDLPVGVSMTFEGKRCLTGADPLTFIDAAQNMGVDLVATNCSAGPEQILDVVKAMLPRLSTPLYVAANAGLPELDENGDTVFRLAPEPFAEQSKKFFELGAKFVGGCCGTGPAHIKALKNATADLSYKRPEPSDTAQIVLTSRGQSVCCGFGHPGMIIGERINPTGKEQLTAELQEGKFAEALNFAEQQLAKGAPVLDVNVGAAMVDEKVILPELVKTLSSRFQCPLCLDTSDTAAMEAALYAYPGSPLVNSISGEPGQMAKLGPLCKLFGAPFILLPIQGRKLPVTAAERIAVIESMLAEADALGIPRRLIMVDVLALTVSSKPEAARACLDVIRHCKEEWGLATVFGLSNISFGLPARELVNSTFLAMCMAQGLSAFIANPNSAKLQETMAASEVLLNRDPQASRFIAGYQHWTPGEGGGGQAAGDTGEGSGKAADLHDAVVRGAKDSIVSLIEAELEKGTDPFKMVNEKLIPAIMEVGDKYERKEYFLPQLLLSAETLQTGFARLKPLLEEQGGEVEMPVVVMATVEGDIHDIGKNIVCLMLKNQGFEVVDLGKDVAASDIVAAAKKHNAKIIGLSALMTTTMVRMEDTVKMVREEGLDVKVMIGGAVVTGAFSEAIGAHGYSTDAVGAVRLAKQLAG